MPPKKKAADAQAVEEKRQHAEHLRRQCQAVELLLMLTGEEIRQAQQEVKVATRRGAELRQQCEDVEQTLDTQMRAMLNMSVTNEESMNQRLRSLEQQVADAEAAKVAMQNKIVEMRSGRGEELRELSDSVKALRSELEEKALLCGVQLRDILLLANSA